MPIVGFGDLAPRDNTTSSSTRPSAASNANRAASASTYSGYDGQPQDTSFAARGAVQSGPRTLMSNPYIEEDTSYGISMMEPPPRWDGSNPTMCQMCCPRIAFPRFTTALCIVQFLTFIITLIVGAAKYDGAFVSENSLGGPSAVTLEGMGGKYGPDIKSGQVWRLLTAIFLHAGILHLLSNLLFQIRFGYTLEVRWSWWRFLLVYILAGISASLWSTQLSYYTVSVGASGALFGLVGSDITYLAYNYQYIPHSKREAIFIAFIILITFLFGIGSDNGVDNYAHLGGFIGGLPLGIAIPPTLVKREQELFIRVGASIVFGGLFLLFVLLIWV